MSTTADYANKKLQYYGKPISLIEKHCCVMLWILVTLSVITLFFDVFGNNLGVTVDTGLRVVYVLLMIFSIFSYSLLDRTTFFINVITCLYVSIWKLISTVITIVTLIEASTSAREMVSDISGSLGDFGKFAQAGADIATGSMVVGTFIGAFISVTIIAYFILVIVDFIKHRKLFFTDFKQLKAEYVDEDASRMEIQQKAAEQEAIQKQTAEQERLARIDEQVSQYLAILDGIPKKELTLNFDANKNRVMAADLDIKLASVTKSTVLENLSNFVSIDVETTGISVGGNRIVEISAIKVVDFQTVECMSTLINPKMSIPPEATAINNITDDMVADAPEFYQVKDCFEEFIGEFPLIGHNIGFDLKHLYASGLDLTKRKKIFDTLILAKKCLTKYNEDNDMRDYDVYDYKLGTLCSYYGMLASGQHRSLSDCFATGFLFEQLVHQIIEE